LKPFVEIAPAHRRRIARDPGGDALDAIIAAVGAVLVWRTMDHDAVARCSRTRREGYLYA
jgi:hypothetical protein